MTVPCGDHLADRERAVTQNSAQQLTNVGTFSQPSVFRLSRRAERDD
jgi:hypothetical protein